jgi:two-component system NtrC family sensor kinase
MMLSPPSSASAIKDRILIFSTDVQIHEDLRLSMALHHKELFGTRSGLAVPRASSPNARPALDMLEIGRCETETEVLVCIESAAAEHRPVTALIIDGRLVQNRDPKSLLRRLWHLQRNLHVLLHDVSGRLNFDQLAIELGDPPHLLMLQNRLSTFEMAQIVRLLVAKSRSDKTMSYRDLDQNTQLLDLARRFEDASNRLHNEQELRMRLEDRLARTQRLETLGRLAEGVAHYFNNHLTVTQSHLSIAMSVRDGSPRLIASLEELFTASKEAAEVSAQLLKFNHLEPAPHTTFNLERCIQSRVLLIKHVLGAQIDVETWFEPALPDVTADPASLGQITLMIAVHARDAMPAGGRLSIRGHRVRLPDEGSARRLHPEARCGEFVVLAIGDGSQGLKSTEIASLLDRSPVHDHGKTASLLHVPELVRQQHGWMDIKSITDVGTEFLIYLPCVTSVHTETASPPGFAQTEAAERCATILVVDDEDSVRQVIEYVLTSQGHNVLLARDANEAWQLWRSRRHLVKLAIVDVQLPGGANGFDLEKALCEEEPSLPVIFTCGFAAANLQHSKKLVPGENFLPKPFGMPELLTVVGNALLKPAQL